MAPPSRKTPAGDSLARISNVLMCAAIIGALYLGREILVPLALAGLLTFLLAPIVSAVERRIGRVSSVILVVTLLFSVTLALGWTLTRQGIDLINELPNYKENIRTKIRSFRVVEKSPFSRVVETWDELKTELPSNDDRETGNEDGSKGREPIPVEVISGGRENMKVIQSLLAPVVGPLGTAGLVFLLLVFMLLQKDGLRNRVLLLAGEGRFRATTNAMNDAGERVSRYLLMQVVVNVTYGIPVALGLYFIGIPSAILWGALATVLRFIPYVGPWVAAAFPILLSFAVSPDWTTPLYTIALFVALELISNNVMEPLLYGSSTGVTPFALIVAALVWTWLWGPVGLVLATPLTVCMVVMGRHIPGLGFLSVILSDEDPLTPADECYHHLLAGDETEASATIDRFVRSNSITDACDCILLPVLVDATADQRSGKIDRDDLRRIEHGILNAIDEVRADDTSPEIPNEVSYYCIRPGSPRDRLASEMLTAVLAEKGSSIKRAPTAANWNEKTKAIIICAVAPFSLSNIRRITSKTRKSFPAARIVACLWGTEKLTKEFVSSVSDAGADEVHGTLADTLLALDKSSARSTAADTAD